MLTDWTLVRRAALEIEDAFGGARVADAGTLSDGRVAIALRGRRGEGVLAIDPYASPPAATIEPAGARIDSHAGFARAVGTALRGTILAGVRSRRGDRLVRLQFRSRSRFGVGDELDLYAELVPRFGNVLLVKGDTIVAAAKEFSAAENPARPVEIGRRYEPPPARDVKALPKALASVTDAAAFWALVEDDRAMREPLYVYRRNGALLQAHLVPLTDVPDAAVTREPSLLALFAELRAGAVERGAAQSLQRRREAIERRLRERERKLRGELDAIGAKERQAGERDALRAEGDAIYASLHDLAPESQADAKERAAKLFARYRKLGASLPHLQRRRTEIEAALEAVEALRWETARAGEHELADVESAAADVDRHGPGRQREAPPPARAARARKRAPLEYRTASGSRIVVGRSPTENADVTFRIARPNDLWFHAQGMPGAHVVLARDDRSEPPPEDVEAAASLAALHSKGRGGAKVPVDYTARKYVRKRPNAPPGLVWYTNPTTVLARPHDPLESG